MFKSIYRTLITFQAALFLTACALGAEQTASASEVVIKDNDRIVFIGDSITGQGANRGKDGWIALIDEGMSLEHPTAKLNLIGLGGSGSTVNAWLNYEKKSRTSPIAFGDKAIDVGKTLDDGAQIVVVMLGMNDVLAPSLKGNSADFDVWATKYSELIDAIRARSHPRTFAVATVTPCTEDPVSPKNKAVAELNVRIAKLAQEKGLVMLPTNEAAWEVWGLGRAFRPDFHVTTDFVHPNKAGHVAIAAGMLRGLGEEKAARKLLEKYAAVYQPAAANYPTLSYTLVRQPSSPDDASLRFFVDFEWTSTTSKAAPLVRAVVPEGWNVSPLEIIAAKGRFECKGPLDHLENRISLTAATGSDQREQTISIPAGWRIAVGSGKGSGWTSNSIFDPSKDRQPLDETLANGEYYGSPVSFQEGDPSAWVLHVASHDYTGINRPGSIDMAAVAFFKYQDQAYGARWIYSERDRPVNLNLGTQVFAAMNSLSVWVNGKLAYEGKLLDKPGRKVTTATQLRQGWNLLFFKSSFIQWQWQFSIDVAGQENDDLAFLRYATKPPEFK